MSSRSVPSRLQPAALTAWATNKRARRFGALLVAVAALSACSGSTAAPDVASATTAAPSTFHSEVIETPEGVVTTAAAAVTIAPGYSEYEPGTTTVAYLLKGEASATIYAEATDTVPSQTIERINGRTLPFVALGNTPDRIRVQLPSRPNGSVGWIDRSKVELLRNDFRIEIDRANFVLTLFNNNKPIRTVKIGIGDDETPTPKGIYYTLYVGKPKKENTVYGAYVIGLSGFSDVLDEFKGGEARLGLHGTNRPDLLGSRVSKGCIRMSDDDVTALAKTLPLGTPVHVIS